MIVILVISLILNIVLIVLTRHYSKKMHDCINRFSNELEQHQNNYSKTINILRKQLKELRVEASEQIKYPIRTLLETVQEDHTIRWKAHAYPLTQVAIKFQLIKQYSVSEGLPILFQRLMDKINSGAISGEESDDDVGFQYTITQSEDTLFK